MPGGHHPYVRHIDILLESKTYGPYGMKKRNGAFGIRGGIKKSLMGGEFPGKITLKGVNMGIFARPR